MTAVVRSFLRQKAAEAKVATQVGNQGTASNAYRRAVEIVSQGGIGEVRKMHAWNINGGSGPRATFVFAVWLYQGLCESRLSWTLQLAPVRVALVIIMVVYIALCAGSNEQAFISFQF